MTLALQLFKISIDTQEKLRLNLHSLRVSELLEYRRKSLAPRIPHQLDNNRLLGNPLINEWETQLIDTVLGVNVVSDVISYISVLENRGCGVWVLSTSRPVIFGNHISECCDHGVAFVSTADDLRENQKLSAQFLQQDQEQVGLLYDNLHWRRSEGNFFRRQFVYLLWKVFKNLKSFVSFGLKITLFCSLHS
jgi:hypothetical protein